MPAKPSTLDTNYIVHEYGAGHTVREIARKLRVSRQSIYAQLHGAQVALEDRRTGQPIFAGRTPLSKRALTLYQGGWSEKRVADHFGVSRRVVRHRLLEAGIEPRGQSDSERLKWAGMSARQRERQVAAAHLAATGRVKPIEEMMATARSREARVSNASATEHTLFFMLRERGIETIQQQAIGPYNCDMGAFPVAVEIWGGHWHWSGRHIARTPKRLRYLFDAGWHVLVILVARSHPLTEAAADYVADFIREARRNPSAIREYRVIGGTCEPFAAGRADDDEIAIKSAFTLRRNRTTGRYERVARNT